MKKTQITLAAVSFGLALIFYLLDQTKFVYAFSGRSIQIYPVAFFALLGLLLLIRMATKNKHAES